MKIEGHHGHYYMKINAKHISTTRRAKYEILYIVQMGPNLQWFNLGFFDLGWSESNLHSIEILFQILIFDLFVSL